MRLYLNNWLVQDFGSKSLGLDGGIFRYPSCVVPFCIDPLFHSIMACRAILIAGKIIGCERLTSNVVRQWVGGNKLFFCVFP